MIIVDYILTPQSHFGGQKDYFLFGFKNVFLFSFLFSLIVYQKHANHGLDIWNL